MHNWRGAEGLYPTLNLVFSELFPKCFCPNYCFKVAFTLVCDFDASNFNKLFADFFKLLFFVMRMVRFWALVEVWSLGVFFVYS